MAKTTNVAEDGAVVGIQSGSSRDEQVTNVASRGAVVGMQGGNVSGCTVVVNGETVTVTSD